jgi:hypothetical protein
VEGKCQGFKGDPDGDNGYITGPKWDSMENSSHPRLRELLSEKLGDTETHDLHGLIDKYGERGMTAWADRGSTFRGTFDLNPGSRSMQVLNDYRAKNGVS